MTVPFPSLSNTLRPSTKSSKVPRSFALQMYWCIGRNWSKSSILVCMSVENNESTDFTKVEKGGEGKKVLDRLQSWPLFELFIAFNRCCLWTNVIIWTQSINTNLTVHIDIKGITDGAQLLYIRPTFWFGLSKDMHDLCVCRILAQSPNQVTTLGVSDFHLVGRCPIKQLESIFEVCGKKERKSRLLALRYIQVIVIQ